MPCFDPRKGYRSKTVNPSGKRSIVFNVHEGYKDRPVQIPCGQCVGCRLRRSAEWAVRIHHESTLYDHNSFLTLTYSDEHLPPDGGLRVSDFQKFMKRLRRSVDIPERREQLLMDGDRVRFFHCGEYGDRFSRPHYHACIFGLDFKDKELVEDRRGVKLYESPTLEAIWEKGKCRIGDLTFQSAAYVARYICKKVTGERAEWYYNEIDPETGEILRELKPEYVTMSRRPGIGKRWFEKFSKDVFPSDFVVINGKKFPPPKFYKSQFEILDHEGSKRLRGRSLARTELAKSNPDNSPVRLQVREEVTLARLDLLKRGYENGD